MPTLTDRKLTINHDHTKKTAKVAARCDVNFNAAEVALMSTAPSAKWFKLKCQLWGADSGITGSDDFLYTISDIKYFPSGAPRALYNNVEFTVTLGEGVLNEDDITGGFTDEIYAKFLLTPLAAGGSATGKSNQVSHNF